MNEKELLGSKTAKGGFKNEDDVVSKFNNWQREQVAQEWLVASKFNNWQREQVAQEWLVAMGYTIKEIEYVKAVKVSGNYKTDVQVQVTIKLKQAIDCENLSVKLVSNPQGFNQVDKREVDKYVQMWKIPQDVEEILKLFTGKTKPIRTTGLRDSRRMFLDEMPEEAQKKIINFFKKNKSNMTRNKK